MNKKLSLLAAGVILASLSVNAKNNAETGNDKNNAKNPAKFSDKVEKIITQAPKKQQDEKVLDLSKYFQVKIRKQVDTLKKGDPELVPANLDDLLKISDKISEILQNYSKFSLEKDITKEQGEEILNKTNSFLKDLIEQQRQLDDFFARDLENNPRNTNLAIEISNYLADVVIKLKEMTSFAKEAKKDLFSHKDLSGPGISLKENSKLYGNLGVFTAVDPDNKDNIFKKIPENFTRTSGAYKELLKIKKDLNKIIKDLNKELAKPNKKENLNEIYKLRLEYLTKLNEFTAKKYEILSEKIPKDIAKIVNDALDYLNQKNKKNKDNLNEYKKLREEVLKLISSESNFLEPGLTGDPYNLQEALNKNDLDEVVNILVAYLKENRVLLKYKTDDFGEIFRGKFKKGQVPTFESFEEALKTLKSSQQKEIHKKLEELRKSIELMEKAGEEVDENILEKLKEDYLEAINQTIYYLNAENLFNKILKELSGRIKNLGKNQNNLDLEKDRRKENSLQKAFELVGIDYLVGKKEIEDEEYNKQPQIRYDLAKLINEIKIKENTIKKLESDLQKSREILAKAGISPEKDKNIKQKKDLIENLKQKLSSLKIEHNNKISELRKSIEDVLNIWQGFENKDGKVYNELSKRNFENDKKIEELKKLIKGIESSLKAMKTVYDKSWELDNYNLLNINKDEESTKKNTKANAKILLELEKRLIAKKAELARLEKELKEGAFTWKTLERFMTKVDKEVDKEIKENLKLLERIK